MKKELQMYLIASSYVLVYYLIIAYFERVNPLALYSQLIFFGSFFGITIVTHIVIPLLLFRFSYLKKERKSIIARKITTPGLFILLLIFNNITLNLILVTHTEISNNIAINKTFPQGIEALKTQMLKELVKLEGSEIEVIKYEEQKPYYSGSNATDSSGERKEISISIIYEKNKEERLYRKNFSMETGETTKTYSSVKMAEERLKEKGEDDANRKIALANLESNTFLMDDNEKIKFSFEESTEENFDYKMIITNIETNREVMIAYVEYISMHEKNINEFSFNITEERGRRVEMTGTFYLLAGELEIQRNDYNQRIKIRWID